MPQRPQRPQRLVLVGGGHAHAEVLRRWSRDAVPGVELVLVAAELHPFYSGRIPGVIAGHHPPAAAQLDLRPLAAAARAVLLHDQALHVDPAAGCVHRRRGGPVPFDVLSLDVGSLPSTAAVPGAEEWAIGVKPPGRLLHEVEVWEAALSRRAGDAPPFRVVLVGGGAAGVEVLLALRHRWRDRPGVDWTLVTAGPDLLPGFPAAVRRRFRRLLAARQVRLAVATRATAVGEGRLRVDPPGDLPFDALLWSTGGAPPGWLARCGLATDAAGCLAVDAFLRSTSDARIFGAGDCVTQVDTPCPKAGVFAVRQGPVLAANLSARLRGRPLTPYRPQARFLTILATGDRRAVARRGPFHVAGGWVWRWKDAIDRRWLDRYRAPAHPLPGRANRR